MKPLKTHKHQPVISESVHQHTPENRRNLNPRGAQMKLLLPGKCYKKVTFSSVQLHLIYSYDEARERIMNTHIMCYNAPTVLYYHSYKH